MGSIWRNRNLVQWAWPKVFGRYQQYLSPPAACLAFALVAAFPNNACAQNGVGILPPKVSARDGNGVDLIGGSLAVPMPTLSAGSNGSGISRTGLGYNPIMDNLSGVMTAGFYNGSSYNGQVTVTVNGESEKFYFPDWDADGNAVSVDTWGCATDIFTDPNGGPGQPYYTGCFIPANLPSWPTTLSCSGPTCTYIMRDGAVATFARIHHGPNMIGLEGNFGRITKLEKPDGEVLNYSYWELNVSQPIYGEGNTGENSQDSLVFTILTPRQVTSSLGWTVRYQLPAGGGAAPNSIVIVNGTIDYCDPNADSCSATDQSTWPSLSSQGLYPNSGESISLVSTGSNPWPTYYVSGYSSSYGGNITTTTYPGPHSYYYWDNDFKIKTLTRNGLTWSYDYSPKDVSTGLSTTTVTNPDGSARRLKFLTYSSHPGTGDSSRIDSIQDELGRTTKYVFVNPRYVSQVITPEATYSGSTLTGGYTQYGYDSRWNITSSTTYPKGGGTPIITSAAYSSPCVNRVTCNKPTSVTDANGNTTIYTYDETHGGILTETGPAVNGVQPQKRYSYLQITPYLKSSTGSMEAQPPVWRLTGTSVCRTMTLATCVGTADEIKTIISYGSDNTHPVYNNVLPVLVTTVNGDGSNSTMISYTYDNFGHVTSVKGPRTDVDDTRYTTYDMYGRPLLQIAADPDGSGPLLRQATRTTYDPEGRVLKVETGTTNTTNGSDFAVTSYVQKTYDPSTGLEVKSITAVP